MLTALGVLIVLLVPAGAIVALSMLIEARRRARAHVLGRQIALTDAVHAELGAVVAPVVEKRMLRPWRVIFAMPSVRGSDVSRLVSIADRVLADEVAAPNDLHIVFTRPTAAARPHAA